MADKVEDNFLVVFDDAAKLRILTALKLKEEGNFIIDEKNKLLTDQRFEPIPYNEFGGILQGSKVPIRKKESDIVKYFSSKRV